jgi:hypothetical protein
MEPIFSFSGPVRSTGSTAACCLLARLFFGMSVLRYVWTRPVMLVGLGNLRYRFR